MKLIIIAVIVNLTSTDNTTIEEFTKANNNFSQSTYKQITKTEENFVASPFSAEIILALTQSGCRGKSAEELTSALHLPNDKGKTEIAIKNILPTLQQPYGYSMHVANKIYIKENFTIKNEFKSTVNTMFQSEIELINFEKNIEAANTINNWVEEQTDKKIENIVKSNDFDQNSRLVLINALYFQANWSIPFLRQLTKNSFFYKSETETVNVDTLHHFREFFRYYESSDLKAEILELPFENHKASMTIVLPNEIHGISRIENSLEQIFSNDHKLVYQLLNVTLPKFKIESSIDFKSVLKNLGVETVFDEHKADLSGISGEPGDLYINKIRQKTFIYVYEEGIRAAATTRLLIPFVSEKIGTEKLFEANHPFLFYIKIKDIIAFIGKVTDPAKL